MKRITLDDYWMGREKVYPDYLTDEVKGNAESLVAKANALLAVLETEGIGLDIHPVNQTLISSGWRPPQINRQVNGAAANSKHMTGQAVDIYDPDGEIDDYLMDHPEALVALGLYLEHPSATKNWSHWQSVPPRSLKRVFYP